MLISVFPPEKKKKNTVTLLLLHQNTLFPIPLLDGFTSEIASIQDVRNGHQLFLFCSRFLRSFCNHRKTKCILFCFPSSKYRLHIQHASQSNPHLEAQKRMVHGCWPRRHGLLRVFVNCTEVMGVMLTVKRREDIGGEET